MRYNNKQVYTLVVSHCKYFEYNTKTERIYKREINSYSCNVMLTLDIDHTTEENSAHSFRNSLKS